MSHEHPFNGASFVVQIEGEEEEGFGLFFLLDCRKEKEGMLGTDGGVFPFFFAWGSLFPFGGWVGEMGWGLPSLPPRSEPIFFSFLVPYKQQKGRKGPPLCCCSTLDSICFVFPFGDLSRKGGLEDVLFETLGFMGAPRPFEPLSWAFCPFDSFSFLVFGGGDGTCGTFCLGKAFVFLSRPFWRTFCSRLWGSWGHLVPLNLCLGLCVLLGGSLKGETKTIPLWHLGKEKQKQKKQRLFFKGAVFCFVDLSFGAKKKELCNDTTDQCLFFIHARYDNAETGRKRIGWLN